ncbi:uncharacterized protein LOC111353567 [Spodoptera litura]|uniref:Uncharacterized protein LOC111353567 n=1 Tax=Spodoptera litura TaxID=69820 RepID=A0A9J7E5A5_SPOLT|nr:uncharacterized protein LOC111353567 [Spodoptera litura]
MARSVALLLVFALIVSALAAPSEPKEEGNNIVDNQIEAPPLKEKLEGKYKRFVPLIYVNSVHHDSSYKIGNGGSYHGNGGPGNAGNGGTGNAGNGGTFGKINGLVPSLLHHNLFWK